MDWDLAEMVEQSETTASLFSSTQAIIDHLLSQAKTGDHVLIMSNGGFEGIHQRLLDALQRNEK
jgi:UDP-N-acetylmuramate: L-alanyl-gamma-D-glutamyl-meso-diaminopimelate ligase